MAVNKVIYGNDTIMDITDTSATAGDVLQGSVFYTSAGTRTTGTLGDMSGATASEAGASGLVPAPASGDNDKFLAGDGTWKEGGKPMVILSYGSSSWNDFITAYNNNIIVYCRASSNANPASGTQNRLAFMAYVNNAATPTEVEFQYYRSVSSHSSSQMGDQVFVYKITSSGTWSVTTREASIKTIVDGTNISTSYNNNSVTINAPANVSAFTNDAGYLTSHQDISGKANSADLATVATSGDYEDLSNTPAIPTVLSDLTNDVGYLTSYTETDPTVPAWAKNSTKPTYTADEVGAIATTRVGAANGVASLDANGLVPTSQLPSYVDDVLEFDLQDISNYSEWVANTSYNVGDIVKVTRTGLIGTSWQFNDGDGWQSSSDSYILMGNNNLFVDTNNTAYNTLNITPNALQYGTNIIYNNSAWIDKANNIITFIAEPNMILKGMSGVTLAAFKTWLEANVTRLTPISSGYICIKANSSASIKDDEWREVTVFPGTGETGKIYVALDTNKTYRWSGSAYVEISPSLALGETSSTAYRGDRGKTAYDHASAKGSAFASGLYKVTTNAEGHVTAATAVQKSDITALGVLGDSEIDDTAGTGNTNKTWSADKLTAEFAGIVIATMVETQAIISEYGVSV